jgi:glycine/D-amino acid oxidase-like deaminating enzyme
MLQEAAAVIIGSGALGSSVAYHLAKAGLAPVALVDKHEIASQTSPRAAGLTSQIRHTELMTRLAKMAVDKIKDFAAETGEDMVYFQSGSLRIARTAEHERLLRCDVERGQKLGVDIDFVTPAKAQQLMPFFEPVGVRAVTYTRDDLYLEPGQLPRGYAHATAKLGGVLLPNTTITGFHAEDGRINSVITDRGEIRSPIVVDAAGAWTRPVASLAGARVGAIATRHQLLITHPILGVEPHHPITRVIDCNVYIRPADGGLMLGGYESDPLQLDMAKLPSAFHMDDLPLDVSVLHCLISQVVDQFPILREIAIKEHRGGLPTMTADGEHIVGPLPELRGFYVAGGCCVGGLSIAPILGDLLAEWIVSGKPGMDLSPLSPARLAVQTTVEDALLEDCRRQYAFHYWTKESLPDVHP